MFAGPYSFYFGSVYTEAMFVLFIALFFYAAAKKKYLWAGLAAAFASATRIVGCLLVFALIVEMYLDLTADGGKLITLAKIKSFIVQMLKLPEHIFAVMLCPFGAFCYMTFLRFFCKTAKCCYHPCYCGNPYNCLLFLKHFFHLCLFPFFFKSLLRHLQKSALLLIYEFLPRKVFVFCK